MFVGCLDFRFLEFIDIDEVVADTVRITADDIAAIKEATENTEKGED